MRIRTHLSCFVAAATVVATAAIGVPVAGAQEEGNQADSGTQDAVRTDPAFCKAITDITIFFTTLDGQPTKKQQRRINRLLDGVEQTAPAELTEPVTTAVEGTRAGDDDSPEVQEALNAINQFVADRCGYPVYDVTGREYEFTGVPASVDTGVNLFRFTNEGAELHEIAILRIKGDESIEELLELPEREANKKIQFMGGTFAEQNGTGIAYVDLKKPGRYAAICFIPVGTIDPEAEPPEGPPHAAEGMVTEFEVVADNS